MRLTMMVSFAVAAFFCVGAAARVRASLGESTAHRELRDAAEYARALERASERPAAPAPAAVAKAAARWEESCAAVYDLRTCVARARRIASDPDEAGRMFSQVLAEAR
jgi:hypothetical protein